MISVLLKLLSWPVIAVLVIFNLRRILFALTIFLRTRRDDSLADTTRRDNRPDVLVLIPCRDEAGVISDLCEALAAQDYPADKYRVVLIDDGSRDQTAAVMRSCVQEHPAWQMLSLPSNGGKPRALNLALAQCAFGEIIYVFDADHRPQASALGRAIPYFEDPRVAGVSGRTIPLNPLASPSAYYSTVESLVHQMVTMRAKDRLNLAPALLGSNCGYRRSALMDCGGFREGALLEDSDITMALYMAGYRVRFAPDVIAYHQVPDSIGGYLRQHRRWGRGFNDVVSTHAQALVRNKRLPLLQRAELLLFATGYLDRLGLAGAGLLTAISFVKRLGYKFPRGFLYLALLTPLLQVVALFLEQRASAKMWVRLIFMPVFLIVDIVVAAFAAFDSLLNRPRLWRKTERVNLERSIRRE
jgi:cellulose synthase/poly-beta-1,6-N-acetylglucosamine synthase-like glycosyltransferase